MDNETRERVSGIMLGVVMGCITWVILLGTLVLSYTAFRHLF